MLSARLTAHFVITSVAASLSLALALLFVTVARTAGWRHYYSFFLVAVANFVYSLANLGSINGQGPHVQDLRLASLALALGFVSGLAWIRFDCQQEGRALHSLERVAVALLLLGIVLCLVPGAMLGEVQQFTTPWFPLVHEAPKRTALNYGFTALLFLSISQLVLRHGYRALCKGAPGLRAASSLVFAAGVAEEAISAAEEFLERADISVLPKPLDLQELRAAMSNIAQNA